MGNINDAFPSNYLKASDIKGVEPVVESSVEPVKPSRKER